jgi:phage terminase Nu1 subunit (DNA packaging protein)
MAETNGGVRQLGRAAGEERARAIGAYCLAHGGRGDTKSFYDADVVEWFEAKENEMRAAGASDPEIVEYLKAGNVAYNALLAGASNYIADGLAAGAGSRHERRVARAKERKSRAHLKVIK